MATYTNIPTANLEPGKPIRSIDIIALRDNLTATAEGAAGAPRIVANALASNSVTTAKILNRNVTEAKLAVGTAETNWVLGRNAGATAGAVGTYAFVTRVTRSNSTGRVLWGATAAGSTLRAAAIAEGGFIMTELAGGSPVPPVALSGTWRVMGLATGGRDSEIAYAALAVRIS